MEPGFFDFYTWRTKPKAKVYPGRERRHFASRGISKFLIHTSEPGNPIKDRPKLWGKKNNVHWHVITLKKWFGSRKGAEDKACTMQCQPPYFLFSTLHKESFLGYEGRLFSLLSSQDSRYLPWFKIIHTSQNSRSWEKTNCTGVVFRIFAQFVPDCHRALRSCCPGNNQYEQQLQIRNRSTTVVHLIVYQTVVGSNPIGSAKWIPSTKNWQRLRPRIPSVPPIIHQQKEVFNS